MRRRNEGAGETGDPRENPLTKWASPDTIPTCENPVTRPGIEPSSSWWEVSVFLAQPPWPLRIEVSIDQRRNEEAGETGDLLENPPKIRSEPIPEKIRRPAASPVTIPTCENPGAIPLKLFVRLAQSNGVPHRRRVATAVAAFHTTKVAESNWLRGLCSCASKVKKRGSETRTPSSPSLLHARHTRLGANNDFTENVSVHRTLNIEGPPFLPERWLPDGTLQFRSTSHSTPGLDNEEGENSLRIQDGPSNVETAEISGTVADHEMRFSQNEITIGGNRVVAWGRGPVLTAVSKQHAPDSSWRGCFLIAVQN
ncbi:hypothetical protein PR048_021139 [Dryococelus australis]|uniref:Uncharacterized protein n=1 Tax=Dryococelus australis TaxID=614101 RepID=A0ABQ9GXE1_9NEOP|nr:hypothetical protein PR048_021139 [Dryococelus australis]